MASPMASFTKEINLRLAKRPLETNGRLANGGISSLIKDATGHNEFNGPYVCPLGWPGLKWTVLRSPKHWR